jgi:hypothetical protein
MSRLWFRIRLNDESIGHKNRITIMTLKRNGYAGLGKDRRSGEGLMSRGLRSMGVELCAQSMGSGGKLGQQGEGLELMRAWRGQSWWPDKGSVHGPTWPCGEPSPSPLREIVVWESQWILVVHSVLQTHQRELSCCQFPT